FYTAFPIHVVDKLGWSITEMGIFFSVLSFVMVLVQGPVLTFASKRFSDKKLVMTGSFLLAVNFLLLLSGNMILIYLAAVFFALGNGLMWPSFLSLLSKVSDDRHQGTVQGFASSTGSFASIIGLITGGILYEKLGALTFLLSAIIIFLVFLLSLRMPKA
ncbi:MAG: MFS transporter, partial [Ignavibacteria bacterium]